MTRAVGRGAGGAVVVALAAAASTLTAKPLAAQPPAAPDSGQRVRAELRERRVCFRGRPLPRCDAFWLTEVGFYARATGTTFREQGVSTGGVSYSFEDQDLGNYVAWELGGMVNRGARSAVGGAVLLGAGDGSGRLAVKGRYRRWLDRNGTAADLSLGIMRANVRQPQFDHDGGTGLTADASLNASDFGAVTIRADVVRGGERTAAALYGGVRLGSRPAVIGTAALALYTALMFAALAGGG